MAEIKNENGIPSFKRKLWSITYAIKMHFSRNADKIFKDRVQKLIINECLGKNRNNSHHHLTNLIRGQPIISYGIGRDKGHGDEVIGWIPIPKMGRKSKAHSISKVCIF